MSDVTVSVIDSNEGWQQLVPSWNSLLEASSSGAIFLTWEWLSSWAECCLNKHRSLFVITFHEDGCLIGIAPFYINYTKSGPFTQREIRFLGSPESGSDYLDVFAKKGREREVADALYDFLMREGKNCWDIICLQDIPANALFLLYFMNRIRSEGKYAEITYSSYCPVANLHDVEGGFPAQISLKRKKKFKQELGILHREPDVEHSVERGESLASFEEFFRLYEGKAGWTGTNIQQILRGFISKCNGSSPVQIDLLSVKGQNVAGLLHLHYRDTVALYLMAVDKEYNPKISIGNLLVGLCIKNSSEAGYTIYDFLKGEESYKFHWATGGRSSLQLNFWHKRPASLTSGFARLVRHAGKLVLR